MMVPSSCSMKKALATINAITMDRPPNHDINRPVTNYLPGPSPAEGNVYHATHYRPPPADKIPHSRNSDATIPCGQGAERPAGRAHALRIGLRGLRFAG